MQFRVVADAGVNHEGDRDEHCKMLGRLDVNTMQAMLAVTRAPRFSVQSVFICGDRSIPGFGQHDTPQLFQIRRKVSNRHCILRRVPGGRRIASHVPFPILPSSAQIFFTRVPMATELEVVFPNGYTATYPNPTSNVCISIVRCPHWDKALLISWWNVPSNKAALFFESENCDATASDLETLYSFSSDQRNANGIHHLTPSRAIRSMMVDEDTRYKRKPSAVHRKCPIFPVIRGSILRVESATVGDNETTTDTSFEASGLSEELDQQVDEHAGASSNWFEPLPSNKLVMVSGTMLASAPAEIEKGIVPDTNN